MATKRRAQPKNLSSVTHRPAQVARPARRVSGSPPAAGPSFTLPPDAIIADDDELERLVHASRGEVPCGTSADDESDPPPVTLTQMEPIALAGLALASVVVVIAIVAVVGLVSIWLGA